MGEITTNMSIRRLGEHDGAALARLAGLDSKKVPEAPILGVEVEGRLLAAISLPSGETVADPFSRTDELRSLLKLRASQLRRRERGERRVLRFPTRSRAALAGSPPGAGGRLLTLPPRAH